MASTASTAYDSLNGMVVNTLAQATFAAYERSLFLGGMLIPAIQVPAGSYTAQVPFINAPSLTVEEAGPGADFEFDDLTVQTVNADGRLIVAKTFGARTIVRDVAGVDIGAVGTLLGNKVAAAWDTAAVTTLLTMNDNTPVATGGDLDVDMLFQASSAIRAAGETGALYGIISPAMAYQLMKNLTTTNGSNIAGGSFQSAGLQTGFVTQVAGITLFQSSYATGNGVVFGEDAARMATFKGLDVEIQRRSSALGYDVVASIHAGLGIVDGNRGVVLTVA
jgi:hypothetical protein